MSVLGPLFGHFWCPFWGQKLFQKVTKNGTTFGIALPRHSRVSRSRFQELYGRCGKAVGIGSTGVRALGALVGTKWWGKVVAFDCLILSQIGFILTKLLLTYLLVPACEACDTRVSNSSAEKRKDSIRTSWGGSVPPPPSGLGIA